MNTNDNPHDAPPELLAQAYRIALYFAERGIKNWSLGPVAKGFNATTNAARAARLKDDRATDIVSGKAAYPPTHSLSDLPD